MIDERQEWLARLEAAEPGDIIPRGLLSSLVTVQEARDALPERLALRPIAGGLEVVRLADGACWDCSLAGAHCQRCASEIAAIAAGRLNT